MVRLRGLNRQAFAIPAASANNHPSTIRDGASRPDAEKCAHAQPLYQYGNPCRQAPGDIDLDQMETGSTTVQRYPCHGDEENGRSLDERRPGDWLTVGGLAKVFSVSVETIRYYQGRECALPVPEGRRQFQRYHVSMVQRIGFISGRRAWSFSLDEVGSLLDLEDGRNPPGHPDGDAATRQTRSMKVGDLERIRGALRDMLAQCEEAGAGVSPAPSSLHLFALRTTAAYPSIAIARWSDIAGGCAARAAQLHGLLP